MKDRATLWGVLGLIGLLVAVMAVSAGSEVRVFWKGPALMLVLGGMVMTAWAARPHVPLGRLLRELGRGLSGRRRSAEELVVLLVALADTARRDGLLALERLSGGLPDEYLRRSLRMAIDGMEPAVIQAVGQSEMQRVDLRYAEITGWLEAVGRSGPVFGMIGTLIGLVLMLSRMTDPAEIGPGVAVAMLTTLYGLVLPHVLCYPLARRLAYLGSDELLLRTIALSGVLGIQAGDNPRVLEQKLRAHLPPAEEHGPVVVAAEQLAPTVSEPPTSPPSRRDRAAAILRAMRNRQGRGRGRRFEEAA